MILRALHSIGLTNLSDSEVARFEGLPEGTRGTVVGRIAGIAAVPAATAVGLVVAGSFMMSNLLSARLSSNESAAIATLKHIASAQSFVREAGAIDVNQNGVGEYGYFGELSGSVALRAARGVESRHLDPPPLSRAFAISPHEGFDDGVAIRSGYVFQMYLPSRDLSGIAEDRHGGGGTVEPDPAASETHWCCYAWPLRGEGDGRRAFFVNQEGEILATANDLRHYSGAKSKPGWIAAYAPGRSADMGSKIAAGLRGVDGQAWVRVE